MMCPLIQHVFETTEEIENGRKEIMESGKTESMRMEWCKDMDVRQLDLAVLHI